MDPVVPLVVSHGWAAGVNAYLTVLLFGLTGRLGLADVPATFERTDVLIAAGVMAAVEFGVDKVPLLDSAWDALHTLIRPVIGSLLGIEIAEHEAALDQALAGVGAGTTALTAHAAKAGLRLAINTSPEPFTNIAVSLAEDAAVAGVSLLAANHPWIAAGVASALLVTGALLAILLIKQVRRGWLRMQAWRAARPPG